MGADRHYTLATPCDGCPNERLCAMGYACKAFLSSVVLPCSNRWQRESREPSRELYARYTKLLTATDGEWEVRRDRRRRRPR
jgi:hypothetical protein